MRVVRVGAAANSAPAGKMGTQVIVPYREEDEARLFKPMGDLGQIVRMVRGCVCFRGGLCGLFRVHVIGVGYARREYGSRVPEALGHGVQSRWERLRNQVSAPFFPPPFFFEDIQTDGLAGP